MLWRGFGRIIRLRVLSERFGGKRLFNLTSAEALLKTFRRNWLMCLLIELSGGALLNCGNLLNGLRFRRRRLAKYSFNKRMKLFNKARRWKFGTLDGRTEVYGTRELSFLRRMLSEANRPNEMNAKLFVELITSIGTFRPEWMNLRHRS
ncbi:MAG: hypothetical protein ACTS6G_00385 [Candidatus Hodgkinia cicadicola]